jgi:hypothetical protein
LTVWVSEVDVLPAKFAFPLYWAVIECIPAPSDETPRLVALPETVLEPSETFPSKNVTVPVAVPPPCGCIVAVKATV